MLDKRKLRKLYILIFAAVVAVFIVFYFLAGDQIKYRKTRNGYNFDNPNTATVELVNGITVEQTFLNQIDRFSEFSLYFTTQYRDDLNGQVIVELLNNDDEVLFYKAINARTIDNNESISFKLSRVLEGMKNKNLIIRVTGTSTTNHGVSLLGQYGVDKYEGKLRVRGYYTDYVLSFGTNGYDDIFTGTYYWQMVMYVVGFVALTLILSYVNYCKGRSSYVVRAIFMIEQYQFLISQLVARDFKTKYKRSILGVFWSFLNPLLTMVVQFIVFSTFFKSDISNYPVYLLSGVVCYSFFNECTSMCLQSISGNARLITKVYIPKYIFPLSRTLSSGVNLGITLIPLILVSLITGLALHKSVILIIFFLLCLMVFSLGIGMILATLMVFFRDIQFLWSVLCMIWMYATPLFYPESIIPDKYHFIVEFNPLYHFIKNIRVCLIEGISPEPRAYLHCFIFAVGSLLVGSIIFKNCQDKFTLYL